MALTFVCRFGVPEPIQLKSSQENLEYFTDIIRFRYLRLISYHVNYVCTVNIPRRLKSNQSFGFTLSPIFALFWYYITTVEAKIFSFSWPVNPTKSNNQKSWNWVNESIMAKSSTELRRKKLIRLATKFTLKLYHQFRTYSTLKWVLRVKLILKFSWCVPRIDILLPIKSLKTLIRANKFIY